MSQFVQSSQYANNGQYTNGQYTTSAPYVSGGQNSTQFGPGRYQASSQMATAYPTQYPAGGYNGIADPFSSPRVKVLPREYVDLQPGHLPQVGEEIHHRLANGEMCHERVIKEGTHIVHEKVIELPKRVVQEKVVEVPQIEYRKKYVDVPEIIYQDNIIHKRVEQIQERHIQVPRVRVVEKVVEVPEVHYVDVPIEKIVEVPEYREEFFERMVEVPQYQEVPVPEYRNIPVNQEIERHLPVPVEVTATFEYRMPCIRPVYKEVAVPIYVPRYIEVPVPAHMMDSTILKNLNDRVNYLSKNPATTRDDLQRLADMSRSAIPNA